MDDTEQRRAIAARRKAANVAAKLSKENALKSTLRVAQFSADREAEADPEFGDLASVPWRAVTEARVAARAAGAAAALHSYLNARPKKPRAEEEAQGILAELPAESRWHVLQGTAALATLHGFKPTEEKPFARGRVKLTGRVGKILDHDLGNGVIQLQFANGLKQWYEEDELMRYDIHGQLVSTHDPGPWSWRPPEPDAAPMITVVDVRGRRIWGPRPVDESTSIWELEEIAGHHFGTCTVGVRLFHANCLVNPDNSLTEEKICDGAVLMAVTKKTQQEAIEMVRQLDVHLVTYNVARLSSGEVGEKLFDLKGSLDVEWLQPDIEVCLHALFVEGKAIMDASVEFFMDPHKIEDVEDTKLGYWSDAPHVPPRVARRCWPGLMYLSIYETSENVIFYVVDVCGELALLGGEKSAMGNYGAVWYAEARGDLLEVGTQFPMAFWDGAFKRGTPGFDLLPVKVSPNLFAFLESRNNGDFPSRFVRTIHGRDDRLAGKSHLR